MTKRKAAGAEAPAATGIARLTHGTGFKNITKPNEVPGYVGVERSDYAMFAGDGGSDTDGQGEPGGPGDVNAALNFTTHSNHNGMVAVKSEYSTGDIVDGTSNTFIFGERHVNPDQYDTGKGSDDDQFQYIGFDQDVIRFAASNTLPRQDTQGATLPRHFGSAHVGSLRFGFCDGSVHNVSYTIDADTYRRLGNRKDGLVVDHSKY